jgi:hypothetical protein
MMRYASRDRSGERQGAWCETGIHLWAVRHSNGGPKRRNVRTPLLQTLVVCCLVVSLPLCPRYGAARGCDQQIAQKSDIDPRATHVLAIGCCVPWAKLRSCKGSVDLFVEAATSRLGIPADNIRTESDERATYAGIVQAFQWLNKVSRPEGSVIVYYAGHGTLLPDPRRGGSLEEVFCLWSKDFPFAGLVAIENRIWMTDAEFAQLVAGVPARAKVIIADTCHALGEWHDMQPGTRKVDYGLNDVALLAASQVGQKAYGTLFTRCLTEAMNGKARNLKEAFLWARDSLKEKMSQHCRKLRDEDSKRPCVEQKPTLDDPMSITPRFRVRRHNPRHEHE